MRTPKKYLVEFEKQLMMQAYLDGKREASNIGALVAGLIFGFAVLGFLVAYGTAFGWIPLGDRIDIPRSDINPVETFVIIASLLYAACCLRTAYGLFQRERSSLRWSQWMYFITVMIGGAILLSVIIPIGLKFSLLLGQDIDLRAVINEDPNISGLAPIALSIGEALISVSLFLAGLLALLALLVFLIPPLDFLRRTEGIRLLVAPPRRFIMAILIVLGLGVVGVLIAGLFVVPLYPGITTIRDVENHRLLAGFLFFLPGLFGYRVARQVEEQSDELRRAIALTPGKYIRANLAKSPSAGAIIGFIAILMGFTMATDLFLEPSSVASFLSNIATKGVIAIGVTYLMISGEFDLSVGSILGVTALSFMNFMTHGAPVFGIMEPIPAALLAIFVAMILGAINGVLLITTRIPSFIVTLGTMLAFRAITLVAIAGGRILRYSDHHDSLPVISISNIVFLVLVVVGLAMVAFTGYRVLPALYRGAMRAWSIREDNGDFGTSGAIVRTFVALLALFILLAAVVWLVAVFTYHANSGGGDMVEVGYFDLFNGRVLAIGEEGDFFHMQIPRNANVRLAIVWWFIFVAIFHVILTNTSFGNSIFATGGNEGAARAQGVNVDRVKVQNFVIVALLTGIAAIYETSRNPGVDPNKGTGWELEVIAMTVIGGALLTGGYGSVVGSLLGALIFGMLQTGLVLVGIESRLFSGTIGVIIIAAVVLNTFVRGAQRN